MSKLPCLEGSLEVDELMNQSLMKIKGLFPCKFDECLTEMLLVLLVSGLSELIIGSQNFLMPRRLWSQGHEKRSESSMSNIPTGLNVQ